MSIVTELTKEQEKMIPVYLKKWLKLGLTTDEIDQAKAEAAVKWMYEFVGENVPKEFEHHQSPMACQRAANKDLGNTKSEVIQSVNLKYWWSGYYGFYDYVLNEIFPDKKGEFPLFKNVIEVISDVGYIVPIDGKVFISDNPCKILKDEQGRLHSLDGKALEYRDGFGVYSLDGIRLTEVEFDNVIKQENADKIIAIKNVEVRLVAIKYFGIGNMRVQLNAKTVDKTAVYELYSIELEGSREMVLRMKNPSEDKWHDEFVPPDTKSIEDALRLRWGESKFIMPLFTA